MTDDQDPTGMSHLLAGLKETGPMPEDLNDRIRASLESEQAARTPSPGSPLRDEEGEGEDSTFWSQVDTEGQGPSRRSSSAGRWVLGIAAAAVLVMGIGGIFAIRDDGGSDTAGESSVSSTSEGRQNEAGDPSSSGGGGAPSELPAFAVTESGNDYTRSGLAEEAAPLLKDPEGATQLSDDSVVGSLSTAAGAKDCLGRLGHPELQPVVVDVASFDGTPGVLLVAEAAPDGDPRAWAVTTGCETIWPEPIAVDEG